MKNLKDIINEGLFDVDAVTKQSNKLGDELIDPNEFLQFGDEVVPKIKHIIINSSADSGNNNEEFALFVHKTFQSILLSYVKKGSMHRLGGCTCIRLLFRFDIAYKAVEVYLQVPMGPYNDILHKNDQYQFKKISLIRREWYDDRNKIKEICDQFVKNKKKLQDFWDNVLFKKRIYEEDIDDLMIQIFDKKYFEKMYY
jgi:hypothetical protein